MARFYADENFDNDVVVQLRDLGHDVFTVQEAGRRGNDDSDVLAYAAQEGRIVLTHNRRDFARLHRGNTAHVGIVSCSLDNDSQALAERISDAVLADAAAGKHIRINLPP